MQKKALEEVKPGPVGRRALGVEPRRLQAPDKRATLWDGKVEPNWCPMHYKAKSSP